MKIEMNLSEVNTREQNELIESSRWQRVMWLVLGVGFEVYIHSNRNYKGVCEIWCGLRPEGVNC